MAENEKSAPKRLLDRARDLVRDVLEAIEELARPEPEPQLVPIPVRSRR